MKINNNASSLQNLNANSQMNEIRAKWTEKLGTGSAINRASDDAAGIAISEKMRGEIQGMTQQRSNVQDALSFLNSAEGTMGSISDSLVDMQGYSAQMESPLMSDSDKQIVKTQMQATANSIVDTVKNSTVNGIDLFAENQTSGMTTEFADSLKNMTGDMSTDQIRSLADSVNTMRSGMGAKANQSESQIRNLSDQISNQVDAESRIRDVDMAEAYTQWSAANIMSNSSTAALASSRLSSQNVLQLLG